MPLTVTNINTSKTLTLPDVGGGISDDYYRVVRLEG
jgi:hypothetical protein